MMEWMSRILVGEIMTGADEVFGSEFGQMWLMIFFCIPISLPFANSS
jgi:hypothetical protein